MPGRLFLRIDLNFMQAFLHAPCSTRIKGDTPTPRSRRSSRCRSFRRDVPSSDGATSPNPSPERMRNFCMRGGCAKENSSNKLHVHALLARLALTVNKTTSFLETILFLFHVFFVKYSTVETEVAT